MAALEFPRHRLGLLQELAVRLLASRKPKTDNAVVARDLVVAFQDICTRLGLDNLVGDVDEQVGPVAARLKESDLDGGGPRNAKPQMIVDSLITGLGLTVSDAPTKEITLDDALRVEVVAAVAKVVDPELALTQLRDQIILHARKRIDERYFQAFNLVAAQLDERGTRLNKTPKVPVDALHASQRVLAEARAGIIERAGRAAIDRAKEILERVAPEAAARIDQPVTHKLTPRDVAILRARDPRIPPATIATTLLDGLSDTIPIAWRAPEIQARPYSATQKFAVGDHLEHPKFGRGSVVSVLNGRMEVEFPDGKYTLVTPK